MIKKFRGLFLLLLLGYSGAFFIFSSCHAVVYVRQQSRSLFCSVDQNHGSQTEYCFYPSSGSVMVLMPDLGHSMAVWPDSIIRAINSRYSVLIYNRVGYGHSKLAKYTRNRSSNVWSQQLLHLLQHLHLYRDVYLLAFGGATYYAQVFMQQHPSLVQGLILVNPVSLRRPRKDYQLYQRFLPVARSVGYYEYLGLVNRKSIQKIGNTVIHIISGATEHSGISRQEQWKRLQQKIATSYPTAKHSQTKILLSEHHEIEQQEILLRAIAGITKRD